MYRAGPAHSRVPNLHMASQGAASVRVEKSIPKKFKKPPNNRFHVVLIMGDAPWNISLPQVVDIEKHIPLYTMLPRSPSNPRHPIRHKTVTPVPAPKRGHSHAPRENRLKMHTTNGCMYMVIN